jgi:hypothetical protein
MLTIIRTHYSRKKINELARWQVTKDCNVATTAATTYYYCSS